MPEICLAIAVCALVTWLGWWRPALVERRRVSRWYLLIPGLLIPLTLLSVDWDRLSARGAEYTATLLVTVLLVGFNEELFARGVLLVGVRRLASERGARDGGAAGAARDADLDALLPRAARDRTGLVTLALVIGSLVTARRWLRASPAV